MIKVCKTTIAMFLFCLTTYSQTQTPLTTYRSNNYPYSIRYNSGFIKFPPLVPDGDLLIKNLANGFSFAVNVTTDSKFSFVTSRQFADILAKNPNSAIKGAGAGLDKLKVIDFGKTLINETPAFYLHVRGVPKGTDEKFFVEMYQVSMIRRDNLFIMVCGSIGDNFSKDYPDCKQIVNSFTFQSPNILPAKPKRKRVKKQKGFR